ncbi:hypothetical protein ISCGN_012631 [Ixodes scapularis]
MRHFARSFDWSVISQQTWYEMWRSPKGQTRCVTRKYMPERMQMLWTEMETGNSGVIRRMTMPFMGEGDGQIIKKDGSLFQQLLDTDNRSWMFLHICNQRDGVSRWIIACTRPSGWLPRGAAKRIKSILAQIVSVFFALELLTETASAQKCEIVGHFARSYDWPVIAQHTWYEMWRSPEGQTRCVTRKYMLERMQMLWTERRSANSSIMRRRTMTFMGEGDLQILKKDGSLFQQLLDTDDQTYMFLHDCNEKDGVSRWIIACTSPSGWLPRGAAKRIKSILAQIGKPDITFYPTACTPRK